MLSITIFCFVHTIVMVAWCSRFHFTLVWKHRIWNTCSTSYLLQCSKQLSQMLALCSCSILKVRIISCYRQSVVCWVNAVRHQEGLLALVLPVLRKSFSFIFWNTCTWFRYIHIKPTYCMPLSGRDACGSLWCGVGLLRLVLKFLGRFCFKLLEIPQRKCYTVFLIISLFCLGLHMRYSLGAV